MSEHQNYPFDKQNEEGLQDYLPQRTQNESSIKKYSNLQEYQNHRRTINKASLPLAEQKIDSNSYNRRSPHIKPFSLNNPNQSISKSTALLTENFQPGHVAEECNRRNRQSTKSIGYSRRTSLYNDQSKVNLYEAGEDVDQLYKPSNVQRKLRENSKKLGLTAKVQNIEKINENISHLLSFVDGSKKHFKNGSNLTPNTKKKSHLERSHSRSPAGRISVQDHKNMTQNRLTADKQQARRGNRYDLSMNKTTSRIQARRERIKILESSGNTELKGPQFYQIHRPQRVIDRSDQIHSILQTSEVEAEVSTQSKTGFDLQFYYESMKRRDSQLNKSGRHIFEMQKQKSASGIRDKQAFQKREKRQFLTLDEVEAFKSISRSKRIQSQANEQNYFENSNDKISDFDHLMQIQEEEIKANREARIKRRQQRQRNTVFLNAEDYEQKSKHSNYVPKIVSNPQTEQINAQIQKIKNQLSQSQEHKQYLRERYDNLLNHQTNRSEMSSDNNTKEESHRFQKIRTPKQTPSKNSSANVQRNESRLLDIQCTKFNDEQLQQDMDIVSKSREAILIEKKNYELSKRSSVISKKLQKVSNSRNHEMKAPSAALNQKIQTCKLGKVLSEKIEIDMELRDVRQVFMRVEGEQKWQKLTKIMGGESKNLEREPQYWKSLLSISSQEHNPFSKLPSERELQEQVIFANLADKIAKSFEFYALNIHKKFCLSKLEKQRFSFKDLDLNSKGYLSMEDLVCFVNLYSGKFYRNRDITFLIKSILIEKNQSISLKKSQALKIQYNELLEVIAAPSEQQNKI